MKNILALLKLDYRLIVTYWKWWLAFFIISIFISVVNESGAAFSFIFALFAMTMMALPFEVADKNNLHLLYATLPTNRKSMLMSRYGFMLASLLALLIISVPVGLIIDLIFSNAMSLSIYLTFLSLAVGAFLVAVGVQTPFLYKFGYAKGRIFMWIPLVIVIVVINLPPLFSLLRLEIEFNVLNILLSNSLVTSLVSLGGGALVFIISYFMARRVYLRKDF